MSLRIVTLGGLAIHRDGVAVSGAGTQPRRLAFLALLARAGDRGVSRDRIVALLWPDADEERGRRAVTQALYALRRELGSDEAIVGSKDLRLDASLVSSDVSEFERAVRAEEWDVAAGLYGGAFLEGFALPGAAEFERWAEVERGALGHEYARVVERAAERAGASGDGESAVRWWRKAAAHDPYNARIATRLMQALAAMGDRAGAVRHAGIYRTLMEAELEMPPDPAVLAFAEELRQPASVPPRAAPAAAPPFAAPTLPASPLPAPAVPQVAGRSTPRRRPRWPIVVAAAAALVLTAAVIGRLVQGRSAPLDPPRLLIAPLENRTGDPSLDLVGAMVAEWVTQGVARTELVEVVDARTMLATAREVELSGAPRYLRTLAEANGASVVVSGSYYRDGDSLRFQTQVTEPRSGRVRQSVDLVSAPAARPTEALEPLRERIMGALAVQLDSRLNNVTVATSQPPTYEAYRHFLLGMQSFGDDFDAEYLHFIRAAELDSSYAQAILWAGITSANQRAYPRADSLLHILEAQRERLAPYDQANLEYFYRGFVQGNWAASHAGARRMLQLAPAAGHARYAVGLTASMLNRPREALDALLGVDQERGWGRSWAPKLITLITRCHHQLGDHEAELEWARRLRRIDPGQGWMRLAEVRALAALGRTDELRQRLDEGTAFPATPLTWEPYSPAQMALLAARELAAHGHGAAAPAVADRAVTWHEGRAPADRAGPAARRELAAALYAAGRLDEARQALDSGGGTGLSRMGELGLRGAIAARQGRRDEAAAWSDSIAAIQGPYLFGNGFYWRARIAALMGDEESAVRALRLALQQGFGRHHQIHSEPDFAGLRNYPSFAELVQPGGQRISASSRPR